MVAGPAALTHPRPLGHPSPDGLQRLRRAPPPPRRRQRAVLEQVLRGRDRPAKPATRCPAGQPLRVAGDVGQRRVPRRPGRQDHEVVTGAATVPTPTGPPWWRIPWLGRSGWPGAASSVRLRARIGENHNRVRPAATCCSLELGANPDGTNKGTSFETSADLLGNGVVIRQPGGVDAGTIRPCGVDRG